MPTVDPKTSTYINIALAVFGVLMGSVSYLTTIFGQGTASIIVAVAGLSVAILSGVNVVLHGVSAPEKGPIAKALSS